MQGPAMTSPEPCADCLGDGYYIDYNGPGRFDDYQECWMPSEDLYPCDTCEGTGHAPPPYEPQDDWHGWEPALSQDAHLEEQHERYYEPDLPF